MPLPQKIISLDSPGSIILLEGKRKVADGDREKLIALGKLLATETRHIIFRSGNAEGADFLFSQGVAEVDKSRLQVITPYDGHRAKYNNASETYSIDKIDIVSEPEILYQSGGGKNDRLIGQYASGSRDRNAMKAAYLIRDTVKVLGAGELPPATFAIFYDDPDNPESGGTGHTIRVCKNNGIPFCEQSEWLNWL